MLRRRFVILSSLLIAAFWLVMMALLVRREVLIPFLNTGPGTFSVPTEPTDTWLGLLLNDAAKTPIGYINIRTEPDIRGQDEGVRAQVLGRMRLNLGSFKGELVMNGQAWAAPASGLRDFSFSMRSGEHSTSLSAAVEGGRLKGVIETGGERTPIDLPVGDAGMMTTTPGFGTFSMPALAVGDEVQVETFDPLTMSAGKARVHCLREETIRVMGNDVRTRVILTNLSGMKSTAWIDERGEVMRAETPIGFVLQRMNSTEAIELASAGTQASGGLLEFAAIKPEGSRPFRGATRMQLEFSGLEGIASLPTDDAQTSILPNQWLIAPAGPEGESTSIEESERTEALANDAFLQIDNPRIVEKAREIVGEETDPWKQAMLIYEWVHANVEKNIVPSLPTALDVLNTLEGDCNEHTMLYTALARATVIPTRMVIGLVWSEEFGAFYYHAWPEVYAGRWVWIDPTLGQPIADATHIKLLSGDLMSWWRIAPFMGTIQVRVIEVR